MGIKLVKTLLLALLTFLSSASAWAGSECYSPAEIEAEHTLRLHSQLMVITVTCHQGSHGENLTDAYTGFTKRNISALHKAEHTMTRYYDENGGGGVDRLDRLRTRLANEFGQQIADMAAQPYCDEYRDKVVTLARASSGDVTSEVQRMSAVATPYVQPCKSGRVAARP